MAGDTRRLMRPDDVSRVHVECSDCHAEVMMPLDGDYGGGQMLSGDCPVCGKPWDAALPDKAKVVNYIDQMRAFAQEDSALYVKLEISEPDE